MPDVCTLIVVNFLNTVACAHAPTCLPEKEGKIVCLPLRQTACPIEPRRYECKRPDGTFYIHVGDLH